MDVRIIAATNRHLDEEVAVGGFRMDLLLPIKCFSYFIPPLRERKEDIMLLADHFFKKFAEMKEKLLQDFQLMLSSKMENYDWPGNIRELENLMQRTVLLTTTNIVNEFYHHPKVSK